MRRIFLLALLLPLAACNGAPISTQWKLRNFNLATADLAQTRVAMRGPDWLTPTPENAIVDVRHWRDGGDESQARDIVLHLQRAVHPGDREALAAVGGAPSPTIVELAPKSLDVARAAQQEAARLKAEGAKTRGKLSFSGSFACRLTDIPSGPIAIDIFIHADDETGWLPLYADHDARQGEQDQAVLDKALPPCPKKDGKR
ncbi:MAG: hypothetical protein WB816_04900 [Methylocystis sp.]